MESTPSSPFGVLGDRQTLSPAVRSEIMALAGLLPFLLTALYVWAVIIAVVWWAVEARLFAPSAQASAAMAG